jgi:ERCC4-type nuclease
MIHNIFEKKKKRENTGNKIKPKIIADIHEKDSMIFSVLKSSQDIELMIQPLKIGDFLIGNTIIERKTTSDFISSILNKRLIEQLNQMQQYENKIIIIEGNQEELYSKINPNAVRGFILSIITNKQANIIFTKDFKDTATYLTVLAKQQLKPDTKISLHSRIPKTIEEQKQYILESFPNIGPKKAELLLKKFHSLNNIFNASEQELNEILKNNSKSFKDILNS